MASATQKLTFSSESHDFGRIEQGTIAKYTFTLKNEGDSALTIYKVKATCGCAEAEMSSNTIAPQEKATLKVTLNTSNKLGKIEKEIYIISNDLKNPTAVLKIQADVYFTHPKKDQKNIFSEGCNTCHTRKGKSKQGYELYLADCAMCHGNNGKGFKFFPPLTNLKSKGKDHIRAKTAQGTQNPMMPGFSDKHGGPLDDRQIETLVEFIYNLL